MNIPDTDSKNLGDLFSLLDEADNGDPGEPMTLHRRGHWFKSSIAHHNLLPEDSLFLLNKSSDPQPG